MSTRKKEEDADVKDLSHTKIKTARKKVVKRAGGTVAPLSAHNNATHSRKKRSSFDVKENVAKSLTFIKSLFHAEMLDYAAMVIVGVVILMGIFISTHKILNFKNALPSSQLETYTIPPWLPENSFAPDGVRVTGVKQIPNGCNRAKDSCWKQAIAEGMVQFVGTPAKILIPGYENRDIVFAVFKNSSKQYGGTGLYNCLPLYMDDGSLVGPDIFGGITSEIDWVYGTVNGVIVHDKSSGYCYEKYFNRTTELWSTRSVACPK